MIREDLKKDHSHKINCCQEFISRIYSLFYKADVFAEAM